MHESENEAKHIAYESGNETRHVHTNLEMRHVHMGLC